MQKRTDHGFTLLETLIALAIMAVAFSSILMVEGGAIRTSEKSKQLNVIAMLARNAMADAEYAIENKKFEEVKSEETGEFAETFKEYTWVRVIKEVEFPTINFGAMGGSDSGGADEAAAGSQAIIEKVSRLISKFITKAVREVQVTIRWKRGDGFQKFTVSTYWVDLTHEFPLSE